MHIEKSHAMAQISEVQKKQYSDDLAVLSVNVSDSLYDDLQQQIEMLLNSPSCQKTEAMKSNVHHLPTDQVEILTEDKEQGQGVREENENEKRENNKEKQSNNELNNTISNDFDSVDILRSEPEETKNTEEVTEDDEERAKQTMSPTQMYKRPRDNTLKDDVFNGEEPLRKKWSKCGSCEGCLASDCNECKACMDKLRNGGKNTMRQKCYMRKCSYM